MFSSVEFAFSDELNEAKFSDSFDLARGSPKAQYKNNEFQELCGVSGVATD